MNPSHRLIKQIKHSAGGNVTREGLESALAMLEVENPIGALMSTLAAQRFSATLLDVAEGRPRPEVLAWMTVAAAGPFPARRALAERAIQIAPPHAVVEVITSNRQFREACAAKAEEVSGEDAWGALLLLGGLRRREVRAIAKARPALRRRLQQARGGRRGSINPQLHRQLRELGLV